MFEDFFHFALGEKVVIDSFWCLVYTAMAALFVRGKMNERILFTISIAFCVWEWVGKSCRPCHRRSKKPSAHPAKAALRKAFQKVLFSFTLQMASLILVQ